MIKSIKKDEFFDQILEDGFYANPPFNMEDVDEFIHLEWINPTFAISEFITVIYYGYSQYDFLLKYGDQDAISVNIINYCEIIPFEDRTSHLTHVGFFDYMISANQSLILELPLCLLNDTHDIEIYLFLVINEQFYLITQSKWLSPAIDVVLQTRMFTTYLSDRNNPLFSQITMEYDDKKKDYISFLMKHCST